MKKTFAVLGGDRRQIELARLLARDGQQVFTCALGLHTDRPLETAGEADVVVLPVPLSKEPGLLNGTQVELEQLWELLRPEQLLCAGQVEEGVLSAAQGRGLTLVDYLKREELAVANAVPTALPIGHKNMVSGLPAQQAGDVGGGELDLPGHGHELVLHAEGGAGNADGGLDGVCLLYTSPSPRDMRRSRMPSSA